MKTMSIIGIVLFAFAFIIMVAFQQDAYESHNAVDTLAGWGYISVFYGIAFAIVVLVKSKSSTTTLTNKEQTTTEKLIEINNLRQKGILDEDEFQAMKLDLLRR
jgi:Mn2+/Fe2+ NRAMP family transporter